MVEKLSALLVHQQLEPLQSLRLALETQGVEITRARSCKEAQKILSGANPPHLVFTDTTLPDGQWADVLALAAQAPQPVNVLVVARFVDTQLYVQAIEAGAFDFLTPPFTPTEVDYVVRSAADHILGQRQAQTPNALPVGKLFPATVKPAPSRMRGRPTATPARPPSV